MIPALLVALCLPGQADTEADCLAAISVMNAERASRGLRPLRPNLLLANAAHVQARDCAARGVLDHAGADGSDPWGRVRKSGYPGRVASENAAWNYASGPAVVAGWMASPGHRATILDPAYTDVGVAVAIGSRGDPYCIAAFGGP